MDAAISCCYIRRAVDSVHIVAGDLHIVVSTEEAGQALQRETPVDPLSAVIRGDELAVNGGAARFSRIVVDMSFKDRSMCPQLHDAVAVMFSDRGASQPAERAADMEDEPAVLPPRLISGDEDNVDVMGRASLVSVVGKRGRIFSEMQVEDTEDPWELQRLHDAWLAKEFFHAKKQYPLYGPRVCLDCGKRMDYYSMSKHRRFYCKSRPPVARDSIQPRGVRKRAVEIRNQWKKENKECINRSPRSGGKNHRRRAAREAVEQVPCGESLGIN